MKKLLMLAGCFLAVFGMVSFANALPFSDVITGNWSFSQGTSQPWTFDLDTDVLAVGDIGPEDTILQTSNPTTPALKITFTAYDGNWDWMFPEYARIYTDGSSQGEFQIDTGTRTFTGGIYAAIVGDHQLLVSITDTYGNFGVTRLELLGSYTDNPSAAPVPEPCTMLLIGSGLVGLLGLRKKFKK